MSKKQDRKLDILSNIAEDILDSATAMRIKLLAGASKKRVNAKRIFAYASSIAAVFMLVATSILFILNADTRQIPVYSGMTASLSRPSKGVYTPVSDMTMLYSGDLGALNLSMLSAQNTKKPPAPQSESTQTETTEEPNDLNPTVEHVVHVEQNKEFYITVHIDNPDNFEILSFTLNGIKYSSYMFEEGSDMENLVLKCKAEGKLGITEYTIDAIKYVDGTKIKDVIIKGNRTIKIGVYATGMPLASINNAVSDFDSISFNTSVSDITHILSFNDYELYVYIYSGSTFIGQKEIGLGSSAVTFDGLGDGKDYTFKIVARYNAFDGTGIMLHELATKKIQTPKIVTLDIANTDCFSTELRWSWDINWEDKNFVYLELYQSGRKVRDITYASGECTAILTGLNSNTKYTVKCGYKNGNEIYVEYLPFRTEIVFTPTVEITNIKLPTNANRRLAFGLNITDPSDVCTVTKIEIFSDGSLIRTLGPDKSVYLDNINIFGKYSAKVHYEYDLHDGSGAVSKTTETEFEQYASNLPSAYTEDVWVGRDTIKLTLGLNDALNMSEIKYVELYRDGKLLITLPTQDVYRFENLEFLKQYTAKVYIGYDLGDGYSKGDICNTFTFGTQSEGLAIEDGMIAGIGSCTDTELHLNMPIAPSAFSGNCDITAVYMYDGVTLRKPALNTRYEYYDHGIGARAFQNCANLKTVVLPNTITAVLTCTFDGCTSLENIVIPKNVLCIVESAFTNSGIRQVYIHRALDALQPNAFDKECVILCEIASAHPSWKKNWNTYSTVIFGVVRVESIDGITYAVLGDGSKVEIS